MIALFLAIYGYKKLNSYMAETFSHSDERLAGEPLPPVEAPVPGSNADADKSKVLKDGFEKMNNDMKRPDFPMPEVEAPKRLNEAPPDHL